MSSAEETTAWVALQRVHARYADAVTRRAWSELAMIMSPDCELTLDLIDRELRFEGPDEIGSFIASQLEQFSFFEFVVLNSVFDIATADGRATARMFMQELRQGVDDGRYSTIWGVYHDELERDDAGVWRFVSRRYRSMARSNPDGDPDLTVFDLEAPPLGATPRR